MFDEDARSVTFDIPKPRVLASDSNDSLKHKCCKRVLQKVIKKSSDVSIRKYSFPIDEPIGHNIFENESLLLPYTLYLKQQTRAKRRQRLAIKIHKQYKIISTDLRMRLHISDSHKDSQARIGNQSCLPVQGHIWFNKNPLYKTLKCWFNNYLRLRQIIGNRNDIIISIDYNIKKENQMYDFCFERYMGQVKYFSEFISSDYQKSKDFLNKWDKLKDDKFAKTLELQTLASDKFITASNILGSDYKYRLQQYYGRFLYYLSLPSWRSQNREFARSSEIEAKGFDFGITNDEDSFNVIFERLQKELCTRMLKPPLYFSCPSDLMKIFESIEQQELNHFILVTQMEPQARDLTNAVKYLKDLVAHDSAAVASNIGKFEANLQFFEDNCALLQTKFCNVMNGMFYDSVGATDVLKLNLHLEFVYENVFKEKPTNMNIKSIAKALEMMYIEYNKMLDAIDNDKVQQAIVHYMNAGREKWNKAKTAARELRQFDVLQRALLRAHAPVSKVNVLVNAVPRPSKRKAKRQNIKKTQSKESAQIELTDIEVEYLTLFTEWTQQEDPSKYLHRLSVTDGKGMIPD